MKTTKFILEVEKKTQNARERKKVNQKLLQSIYEQVYGQQYYVRYCFCLKTPYKINDEK